LKKGDRITIELNSTAGKVLPNRSASRVSRAMKLPAMKKARRILRRSMVTGERVKMRTGMREIGFSRIAWND